MGVIPNFLQTLFVLCQDHFAIALLNENVTKAYPAFSVFFVRFQADLKKTHLGSKKHNNFFRKKLYVIKIEYICLFVFMY